MGPTQTDWITYSKDGNQLFCVSTSPSVILTYNKENHCAKSLISCLLCFGVFFLRGTLFIKHSETGKFYSAFQKLSEQPFSFLHSLGYQLMSNEGSKPWSRLLKCLILSYLLYVNANNFAAFSFVRSSPCPRSSTHAQDHQMPQRLRMSAYFRVVVPCLEFLSIWFCFFHSSMMVLKHGLANHLAFSSF